MIITLLFALQDRIAYEHNGRAWSMRPDGTGQREETAPARRRVEAIPGYGNDILRISDGDRVTEVDHLGARDPRFSPDGARVVYEANGGVWTVNADGTDKRRVADGSHPLFLGDGRVAFRVRVGREEKLTLWTLKTEDEVLVASAPILDVAVHGDRIAYSTPEGIHVDGRVLPYDEGFWAHGAHDLVWSPDGDAIACTIRFLGGREVGTVVIGDSEIYVVPLDGGAIRSIEIGDGAKPVRWEKP